MDDRVTRVGLVGSCVTRDIWQFANRVPNDMLFIARTSLASIMSPPPRTLPQFDGMGFDSDFQRRCVTSDLTKTTLREIEVFNPQVLLLDFIDERFDLLEVEGAIITLSHDFHACGLAATLWARAGRRIARNSLEAQKLWTEAARAFTHWVGSLSGTRTVLHAAPWVTHAVRGDDLDGTPVLPLDSVCQISVGRLVDVIEYRALTEEYHRVFATLMPEVMTVEADVCNQLGALGHIWGPTPFHYAKSYYSDVRSKLINLGVEV